jgi:hypothetical protein
VLGQFMLRKLDYAIADMAEDAFDFLERLVATPSTVGQGWTRRAISTSG